jgi:hypothetical protein
MPTANLRKILPRVTLHPTRSQHINSARTNPHVSLQIISRPFIHVLTCTSCELYVFHTLHFSSFCITYSSCTNSLCIISHHITSSVPLVSHLFFHIKYKFIPIHDAQFSSFFTDLSHRTMDMQFESSNFK